MRLTEDAAVLLHLVGLHLRLLPDAFWLTHHPAAVEGHWLGQAANPRPPSRLREGSTLAAQGVGPGSSLVVHVRARPAVPAPALPAPRPTSPPRGSPVARLTSRATCAQVTSNMYATRHPRAPHARAGDLFAARPTPPPHASVGMGGTQRLAWLPDDAPPPLRAASSPSLRQAAAPRGGDTRRLAKMYMRHGGLSRGEVARLPLTSSSSSMTTTTTTTTT